jgi:hypothetical protein
MNLALIFRGKWYNVTYNATALSLACAIVAVWFFQQVYDEASIPFPGTNLRR